MDIIAGRNIHYFKTEVATRFQLYSSLFTSLPFHKIENTGILLSLFSSNCEEGFKRGKSPVEIIDHFFEKHTTAINEKERIDLLFRFIQYVERQIVLFDALEDASYTHTHDLDGAGSLKQLIAEVVQSNKQEDFKKVLKNFGVRLVLTAHPTQFYPGSVLGIIHDLSSALIKNEVVTIEALLQQLGKTPFLNKKKPTPYDEAMSLVWYLENVFYQASGEIVNTINRQLPDSLSTNNSIISLGFWPGGDRDGNPFVTSDITLQVADELRSAILKCYYLDIRKLKRRLTFDKVAELVDGLEATLYNAVFLKIEDTHITGTVIKNKLREIIEILESKHNGLFVHLVAALLNRVEIFGVHFASLDIRQDSSIHKQIIEEYWSPIFAKNYMQLSEKERIKCLITSENVQVKIQDEFFTDNIRLPQIITAIQEKNGEKGCNRYVISQCHSALNIMEAIAMFKFAGYPLESLKIDFVPLFETINDLTNAPAIMENLFSVAAYHSHVKRRKNTQTIMLGFSDGTKDGGYLMANWSIYRAKEELTRVAKKYNIEVIFFDGRGGPPARGGGKTHKFYASLGKNISNKEIQLTIQGQTISANFGVKEAARYNIEQLINAGVSNSLFIDRHPPLNSADEQLLQELSSYGFDVYKKLKEHPLLPEYLYEISPLRFYGQTNIGSRPVKRGAQATASLAELRAIPFAGAWSQLKQNVPGFYGVGTALRQMERFGKFDQLKKLYSQSLYFKTLLDNCEMAMLKCYFPLTDFLRKDEKYGEIFNMIEAEYLLTQEYILKLSEKDSLMGDYPVDKLSVIMRERIVLPILTIQQYALTMLRTTDDEHLKEVYGKLAMRCSFGIINAGRNAA